MSTDIKVVMTLDSSDFSVKTIRAGEQISEFKRKVESNHESMKRLENGMVGVGAKFRDLIFAISIARYAFSDLNDIVLALPKAFLTAGGEMERMRTLMEGLSKETDDTKRRLEALSDVQYVIKLSLSAPFDIKTIQDAFVKFKSVGLDPTDGSLKALTNSVAKFGGTSEQFKRAAVAIQQMAGKGVISMEELRQQLGEAVPNAIELMAEGVGMSMPKLVQVISKGQLEARTALDQMFTVMAIRNRGAAEEMMNTWTGLLSATTTRWELFKASIAESGGENSFMAEMKRALQEINQLLDSPEVKAFARDFGQTLASAVRLAKDAAIFFSDMAGYIKLAGIALFAYFSASKIAQVRSSLQGLRDAAQQAVADNKRGQGGFFQSYAEGAIVARKEVERLVMEQRLAAQAKINANEKEIQANLDRIQQVYAQDRLASANKLTQIQKDTEAAKSAARSLAEEEKRLIAERQAVYRTYIETKIAEERRSKEALTGAYVGRGGSRDNLERLAAVRDATQAKIAEMNATIAANREAQKAQAIAVANTEAILKQNAAQKGYSAQTLQAATVIAQQNAALRVANGAMQAQTAAMIAATRAGTALKTVIGGVGAVFNAMGGWVTVAITALTIGIQKIYEFMNRWKAAKDLVDGIKDGVATEEGNATLEKRLSESRAALQANERSVEGYERRIASKQRRLEQEKDASTRRNLQSQIDAEKAGLQEMLRQKEANAKKVEELEKSLATGKNIVIETESRREANFFKQQTEAVVKDKLKALKEADNKLRVEKDNAIKAAREQNPKVSEAQIEKITAPFDKQIREGLAAMNAQTLAVWKNARTNLQEQLVRTSDATKRGIIQAKINEANAEIDQIESIQSKIPKLGNPNLLNGKDGDKASLDRVDPLQKYVNERLADLTKAKLTLEQVRQGTDELITTEQNSTLEVLSKLANGDFNFKDGDKNVSNFNDIGQAALNSFMAQIKDGSVDIEKFINGIKGLDVAFEKNGKTVRQNLLAAIQASTQNKQAIDEAQLLTFVTQKQAQVTEDLSNANLDLDAGLKGLPSSYAQLVREFIRVELKAGDAIKTLKGYDELKKKVLGDALMAGVVNETIGLETKLREEQIRGITNSRAREAATHQLRLKEIQEKMDREIAAAGGAEETIAAIRSKAGLERDIENQRFLNANKSALDRLVDDWTDVYGQIDTFVGNTTKGWMDALVEYTTTGSLNLKKMAQSFINDLARIQLQQAFAPIMKKVGDFMTSALGGLFGGGAASTGGTPKYDTSTGGMLVTVTNTLAAAANGLFGQGEVGEDGKVKDQGLVIEMFNKIKEGASSVWNFVKDGFNRSLSFIQNDFMNMVGDFGSSFSSLLSSLGSSLNSILSSVGGGGGDFLSTAFSAVSGFFGFANGGIMSASGSVPLRKYANGGIATSPQLALFGEGSMNEAYVPLPDGRSIPVTMTNPGGGVMQNVQINITVNKDGTETTTGNNTAMYRQMGERIKQVVREELINQQRPGGTLYR